MNEHNIILNGIPYVIKSQDLYKKNFTLEEMQRYGLKNILDGKSPTLKHDKELAEAMGFEGVE